MLLIPNDNSFEEQIVEWRDCDPALPGFVSKHSVSVVSAAIQKLIISNHGVPKFIIKFLQIVNCDALNYQNLNYQDVHTYLSHI